MPDIFLSYSREDQATARRFAEGLQRAGFEVWWDQTLRSGEAYDEVTENALKTAHAVVVLWSKTSVASRWVRAEATIADRKGNLVPAMIEPCERPVMFELRQTAELAHWKGGMEDRAWLAFVDDLREKLGGRSAAGVQTTAGAAAPLKKPLLRRPVVAVGVAVLLASGAAWVTYKKQHVAATPAAAPVAAAAPIMLAMLPFTNLSSDPRDHFSRGLADDLYTQLEQVGLPLRVIGPANTEPLVDRKLSPREIAGRLEVRYLLEANVQREGSAVKVTARLLDGKDGSAAWTSMPYQRKVQDIFTLQQEIATDVARQVGIALKIPVPRAAGGTVTLPAWEHYQRGVEDWQRNLPFDQVVDSFRAAVKADPEYRQAWYMLYIFLLNRIFEGRPDEIEALRSEKATAAAELQKLPADSALSLQFHALRAAEGHQWAAALSYAEAAVAKSPVRDSTYGMANYLLMTGRVRDAIHYLDLTVETEPLNMEVSSFLQRALLAVGDAAGARKESARVKALGTEVAPIPVVTPEFQWTRLTRALGQVPLRPDGRFASGPLAGELPQKLQDEAALRRLLLGTSPDRMSALNDYLLGFSSIARGTADEVHAALSKSLVETPESVLYLRAMWINGMAAALPQDILKSLVRELHLDDYWRKNQWGDFCELVDKKNPEGDFECH